MTPYVTCTIRQYLDVSLRSHVSLEDGPPVTLTLTRLTRHEPQQKAAGGGQTVARSGELAVGGRRATEGCRQQAAGSRQQAAGSR